MDKTKLDKALLEYLPRDLQRIAEVAGLEATIKICMVFGGNVLYVPALGELQRLARDERIRRQYRSGITVRALSVSSSLTERSIWRILNRHVPRLGPVVLGIIDGSPS